MRAAVALLIDRGWLTTGPDGHTLVATGAGSPTNPLEDEILTAARRPMPGEELLSHVSRGPAVAALTQTLIADGYITSEGRRLALMAVRLVPAAIFAIAAIVVGASIPGGDLFAIFAVIVAVVGGIGIARRQPSAVTTPQGSSALLGRQEEAKAERERTPLDPAAAVALFGVRSLWALSPDVAEAMDVPVTEWASIDAALVPGISGPASHGHAASVSPS